MRVVVRIVLAIIVAAGLGACHGPASLKPEPTAPELRVSRGQGDGAWYADLTLTEPAVAVLVQRMPDGSPRGLGFVATEAGEPLPAGRHSRKIPARACPWSAAVREFSSSGGSIEYPGGIQLPSTQVAPAAMSLRGGAVQDNSLGLVRLYGSSPGCQYDRSIPVEPTVVAAVFPTAPAAVAFAEALDGTRTVEQLRRDAEVAGGRLVTPGSD